MLLVAGTNTPEHPIPMLDTAEAIIDTDESIEPFILSLFPEARPDQIAMMKLFVVGWFMEGEDMGRVLALNSATNDIPNEPLPEQVFPDDTRDITHHISKLPYFCLGHIRNQ